MLFGSSLNKITSCVENLNFLCTVFVQVLVGAFSKHSIEFLLVCWRHIGLSLAPSLVTGAGLRLMESSRINWQLSLVCLLGGLVSFSGGIGKGCLPSGHYIHISAAGLDLNLRVKSAVGMG